MWWSRELRVAGQLRTPAQLVRLEDLLRRLHILESTERYDVPASYYNFLPRTLAAPQLVLVEGQSFTVFVAGDWYLAGCRMHEQHVLFGSIHVPHILP